ncbi:MAG: hypothetical protein ACM3U2_00720 [Deltaproteobacteria bacterium]
MLRNLSVLFLGSLLTAAASADEVRLERKYLPETTATMHVESASKLRITGDMKTEINGMELPAKLDLTIENKTVLQP